MFYHSLSSFPCHRDASRQAHPGGRRDASTPARNLVCRWETRSRPPAVPHLHDFPLRVPPQRCPSALPRAGCVRERELRREAGCAGPAAQPPQQPFLGPATEGPAVVPPSVSPFCSLGLSCHARSLSPRASRAHKDSRAGGQVASPSAYAAVPAGRARRGLPAPLYLFAAAAAATATGLGCRAPPAAGAAANFPEPWLPGSPHVPPRDGQPSEPQPPGEQRRPRCPGQAAGEQDTPLPPRTHSPPRPAAGPRNGERDRGAASGAGGQRGFGARPGSCPRAPRVRSGPEAPGRGSSAAPGSKIQDPGSRLRAGTRRGGQHVPARRPLPGAGKRSRLEVCSPFKLAFVRLSDRGKKYLRCDEGEK